MFQLQGLDIDRFLAEYWQQKPLLIREAFPDFESLLSPQELAGLACEAERSCSGLQSVLSIVLSGKLQLAKRGEIRFLATQPNAPARVIIGLVIVLLIGFMGRERLPIARQ